MLTKKRSRAGLSSTLCFLHLPWALSLHLTNPFPKLAYPIYSFVLPVYSFWCFDESVHQLDPLSAA